MIYWKNADEYETVAFEDIRPGDRVHFPNGFLYGTDECVAWHWLPRTITRTREAAPGVWFLHYEGCFKPCGTMFCGRSVRVGVKRAKPTRNFTHRPASSRSHKAQVLIAGRVVAEMSWYTIKPDQRTAKGSVQHIWTDPDYRRQGIASALWAYAQGLEGVTKPRHSRDRTRDGKAWIASL